MGLISSCQSEQGNPSDGARKQLLQRGHLGPYASCSV